MFVDQVDLTVNFLQEGQIENAPGWSLNAAPGLTRGEHFRSGY